LKKKIIAMLAAFGVVFGASAVNAAEPVKIQMHNRTDGMPVEIQSDAAPERKNNRMMVPLRVISEHLGARVLWTGKEAVLAKGDKTITLRPNSGIAVVNGTEMPLDAEPYVSSNRVMVPLRFVAEVFDCDVRYENDTVTVTTGPFAIDGIGVSAYQYETFATLGSVVEHIIGNGHIEALYHAIEAGKGEKVEPPVSIAPKAMLAGKGDWYPAEILDFLDASGNSIRHYELYGTVREMNDPPLGYFLLYAAHEDQWYKIAESVAFGIWQLESTAERHGYGLIVENTVV